MIVNNNNNNNNVIKKIILLKYKYDNYDHNVNFKLYIKIK